jgi:uncharacterized RDD family membrane protein YckC
MIDTENDDYHKLKIDTPERIVLDIPLAGLGKRFIAQVIDDVIRVLFIFVLALILFFLVPAMSTLNFFDSMSSFASIVVGVLLVFFFFALYFGYDIYYEAFRNGQTPGMKFQQIRVVMDNGQAVTPSATFIRSVVGIVDILPASYVLGGLIALLRSDQKRFGDIIAGTSVVKISTDNPFQKFELPEEKESQILFTRSELEKLGPKDYEMLVKLRARAPSNHSREKKLNNFPILRREIRTNLAKRMENESDLSDKIWLVNLERQLKAFLERQF